jgi:hypothetical protein
MKRNISLLILVFSIFFFVNNTGAVHVSINDKLRPLEVVYPSWI